MKPIHSLLVAFFLFTAPAYGNGTECAFDAKGLERLKVGDPETKIRELFGSGYKITEHSGGMAQRRLDIGKSSSDESLYSFSLSNSERVIFIDILGACKNADGIGIGSRLGDARAKYGKAKLEPADIGYFVIFDRIPSIGFMLENKDLPKKLRNLPDDSMSAKSERSILATSNAKFSRVRIYPE